MNLERSRNWAVDIFPSDVDHTSRWVCESRESIREEIKVICTTSWAFIDDLNMLVMTFLDQDILTIAVMLLPEGPVTDTHAPQLAELSQFESDKAVPKIPEGSV